VVGKREAWRGADDGRGGGDGCGRSRWYGDAILVRRQGVQELTALRRRRQELVSKQNEPMPRNIGSDNHLSHPVAAGGEPGHEDTDDAPDRCLTEEEDDQTLFLFLFFDASFPSSVLPLYICLPPIWAMSRGDGRVLHSSRFSRVVPNLLHPISRALKPPLSRRGAVQSLARIPAPAAADAAPSPSTSSPLSRLLAAALRGGRARGELPDLAAGGTGDWDAAHEHNGDQGAGEPVPAGAGGEPDVRVGAGGVGGRAGRQGRAQLLRGAAVGREDVVPLRRDAVLAHRALHCAHRLRRAVPRCQRRAVPRLSLRLV
jgi:hypothetical protein